jgi:hypothetical protein
MNEAVFEYGNIQQTYQCLTRQIKQPDDNPNGYFNLTEKFVLKYNIVSRFQQNGLPCAMLNVESFNMKDGKILLPKSGRISYVMEECRSASGKISPIEKPDGD